MQNIDSDNKKSNNNSHGGLVAAVWVLSALVLGLCAYTAVQMREAGNTRVLLVNNYDRALSDMADAVERSETLLLKASAAGTAQKTAELLQDAAREAAYAEGCMALLPLDAQISADVSNYLVQVSDLSKAWSNAAISDELSSKSVQLDDSSVPISADGNGISTQSGWQGFSDEHFEILTNLRGYASDLSGLLQEMALRVSAAKNGWDDIEDDARELMTDPFEDYPALHYDGQFSDHMKELKAKGLQGDEITQDEGADVVRRLLSETLPYTPTVQYITENSRNDIEVYCYEVTFAERDIDKAYVYITKKGGSVSEMTLYRETGTAALNEEQCEEAGKSFLRVLGLSQMSAVRSEMVDGISTVTYVYSDNGILYYPDAVKIKISADNGEPVGFEGYEYLMNHCERTGVEQQDGIKPVASISSSDARQNISKRLEIHEVKECYIANSYGGEHHAYEFNCSGFGRDFLIYIDAESGRELDVVINE